MSNQLTTKEVAALLNIDPVTWRSYVSRGQAPAPDGHVESFGRSFPVWRRATVTAWAKSRTRR